MNATIADSGLIRRDEMPDAENTRGPGQQWRDVRSAALMSYPLTHIAERRPEKMDYQPDVVLLDISLPGMTDFEAAQWLRQEPELPEDRFDLICRK